MKKFPKRSLGRRPEDQFVNRALNILKLTAMLIGGGFALYHTVKSFYVQEYLYWHTMSPIVKHMTKRTEEQEAYAKSWIGPTSDLTSSQAEARAGWVGHADYERRAIPREGTDEEYRKYLANETRHIRDTVEKIYAHVLKPWWAKLL